MSQIDCEGNSQAHKPSCLSSGLLAGNRGGGTEAHGVKETAMVAGGRSFQVAGGWSFLGKGAVSQRTEDQAYWLGGINEDF